MRFGVCNKPIVSLYETPEFCEGRLEAVGGVADELLYGWTCQVEEETAVCLKVVTEYGYTGYVRREDMVVYTRKQGAQEHMPVRYVNRNFVDILSMPKVQGKVLVTLYRGSYVNISDVSSENGWVEVILNNGNVGYVQGVLLKERAPSSLPEQDLFSRDVVFRGAVVESAMAYLGVQYRWGGKTPLGLDCSGLAFMSYFENGVFIYRDSQIKEGYPVKKIPNHMMNKGDLLYFPGHVGIYMGEGKYIHATAHKDSYGVVVNSLYPWDKGFRPDLYEKLYAVGSIF